MYIIGIDWSRKKYNICIISKKGVKIDEFEIKKNKLGFDEILKKIKCLKVGKKNIIIGIETHKDLLAEYLLSKSYKVYSLNPSIVNKFQSIYSIVKQKDDKFDTILHVCYR